MAYLIVAIQVLQVVHVFVFPVGTSYETCMSLWFCFASVMIILYYNTDISDYFYKELFHYTKRKALFNSYYQTRLLLNMS